jgi:hypothetical protein
LGRSWNSGKDFRRSCNSFRFEKFQSLRKDFGEILELDLGFDEVLKTLERFWGDLGTQGKILGDLVTRLGLRSFKALGKILGRSWNSI